MDLQSEAGLAGGVLLADVKAGLGSGLALLMDELAYGVVVATLQGQVVHANQAARHELGRRRVLLAQNNVLQTRFPEESRLLLESLAKVGEGKRSLITLSAAEGASLTVAVLPLKTDGLQVHRAALMFARASVCESLMLCFFARNHGLTASRPPRSRCWASCARAIPHRRSPSS